MSHRGAAGARAPICDHYTYGANVAVDSGRPGRRWRADSVAEAGPGPRRRPLSQLRHLATAIDDAFARWDRAHLHMFDLGTWGGPLIGQYWDDPPSDSRVDDAVNLSTLTGGGQQFAYVFDLGDRWAHLCTVGPERIDPLDTLGTTPDRPMPYWGWGSIPDQYGRRWDGDDSETPPPPDPELTDLPTLQPGWGPRHQ